MNSMKLVFILKATLKLSVSFQWGCVLLHCMGNTGNLTHTRSLVTDVLLTAALHTH